MRRAIVRVAGWIRDAWLVVGISVLLFLGLEVLYVTQGSARRALRAERAPPPLALDPGHPNAGEAWWEDIHSTRAGDGSGGIRYDPYRGWWPFEERGRHINRDEQGRRRTIEPTIGSRHPRVVYAFGGSVMWGWVVRDSFTIPSLLAARLRDRGYHDVQVVNLAQSMYDLAQNVSTLLIELRHGRVPAVAVFLDGNNEMGAPYQSGEVGRVLNEALLARRFERRTSLRADLFAVLGHSALVQRLTRREEPTLPGDRVSLCDAIAGSYARQVHAVEAVGSAFGFATLFLWQPMRATSGKRLTDWERKAARADEWIRMVRRCTAAVDSALAPKRDVTFFSLSSLFDNDTTTVFVDEYGHMTERANAVIADFIASRIAERLGPPANAPSRRSAVSEPLEPAPQRRAGLEDRVDERGERRSLREHQQRTEQDHQYEDR